MNAMKAQRTTMKTKVKTSANRLMKGIQRKSAARLIESYYEGLHENYLDFIDIDCSYIQAIEDDETLIEDFSVVNNLALTEYTAAVDNIFSEAKVEYDQYQLKEVNNELQSVTEELDEVIAKISAEEDVDKMEMGVEKIGMVMFKVVALKKRCHQDLDGDWTAVELNMKETLKKAEEVQDNVRLKVRRIHSGQIHDTRPIDTTVPITSTTSIPLEVTSIPQIGGDQVEESLPSGFAELMIRPEVSTKES